MTSQLQRIETTLQHLADPSARDAARVQPEVSGSPTVKPARLSFDLRGKGLAAQGPLAATTPLPLRHAAAPPTDAELPQAEDSPTPMLPKLKPTSFTSHRNAFNPGLALGLLQEMTHIVSEWQVELRHIQQQIHGLYAAGPIVAGWLESYTQDNRPAPAELRHVEADCLADWAAKQWRAPIANTPTTDQKLLLDGAGYRLCGLQEDGQLWVRHCPAAQVPAVSLAIARHQQLRQLLARKQHLETHLGQLSERLITLHGDISPFMSAQAPE
jgi:hypothetical protein